MKKFKLYILILLISFFNIVHGQIPYGDGSDNNITISNGDVFYSDQTRARVSQIDNNTKIVDLDINQMFTGVDFGYFAEDNRVLIIQMEGNNIGHYEIADLEQGTTPNSLVFPGYVDLSSFDPINGVVQVIRVPQWDALILDNGTITCNPYDGHTGGIIMVCAIDIMIDDDGLFDASAKGYPIHSISNGTGVGGQGGASQVNDPANRGVPADPQDYCANGGSSQAPLIPGLIPYALEHFGYFYQYFVLDGGHGGSGSSALAGNPGSNGNQGTNVPLSISPNNTPSILTIGNCGAGGNGGISGEAGGHGGAGGNGYYRGDYGELGGDGYPGGQGGDGGSGGGSIWIRSCRILIAVDPDACYFNTSGANGQDGEDGLGDLIGGTGGKGGDGGDGYVDCANSTVYGPGSAGGPGEPGDGSGGGYGGDGGDAGSIWIECCDVSTATNVRGDNANIVGGPGGSGGIGAQHSLTLSFGEQGFLDLDVDCGIVNIYDHVAYYKPYNRTIDHNCKCFEAFSLLSEMDQVSAGAGIYSFSNSLDPYKTCTYDVNTKKLTCTVVTQVTGSSTGPGGLITDIYHCYLDDIAGECAGHFGDIFTDIFNNQSSGSVSGNDVYLPPAKLYNKLQEFLDNVTSYGNLPCFQNCSGVPIQIGGITIHPQRGPDGIPGNPGDSNSVYIGDYSRSGMTPRGEYRFDMDELELCLYPNPAKEYLEISYLSNEELQFGYQLFDVQGKLIIENEIQVDQGNGSIHLDISGLEQGVYFIQFKYNDIRRTIKISKI
jgi:hypothetical protein